MDGGGLVAYLLGEELCHTVGNAWSGVGCPAVGASVESCVGDGYLGGLGESGNGVSGSNKVAAKLTEGGDIGLQVGASKALPSVKGILLCTSHSGWSRSVQVMSRMQPTA